MTILSFFSIVKQLFSECSSRSCSKSTVERVQTTLCQRNVVATLFTIQNGPFFCPRYFGNVSAPLVFFKLILTFNNLKIIFLSCNLLFHEELTIHGTFALNKRFFIVEKHSLGPVYTVKPPIWGGGLRFMCKEPFLNSSWKQ